MEIRTLYRYERDGSGTTVSPEKPEGKEYTEMYRIIADDGMLVTRDGVKKYSAIDTHEKAGWYEVEAPEEERMEEPTLFGEER